MIDVSDVIVVRHYSGINPFKSVVTKIEENKITVKLTKEFATFNFLVGDPVVLGYEVNEMVSLVGCTINEIDIKKNCITFDIDKIEEEKQKRKYERYIVSLYADLVNDRNERSTAIIKDISLSGIRLFSRLEHNIGEKISLHLYIDSKILVLNSKILRKIQKEENIEYGVSINYDKDEKNKKEMIKYINKLKDDHDSFLEKLKSLVIE